MTCISRRAVFGGIAALVAGFTAAEGRPALADPGPPPSPGETLFGSLGPLPAPPVPARPALEPGHTAWVAQALAGMRTVQAGMTRAELETLFERAGGPHALRTTAPLVGVYAYRECLYFQVGVEFQPARPPQRNAFGDVWTPEDPQDIITKISRPYVEQVAED